jgi:N-acetyl-gamma-glutamyl-phosphate reductase
MAVSVFIDGAVGTTGLEIHQRLAGRPELDLIALNEARRKDNGARRDALNAADIVILCLPDGAAVEAVSLIDNAHTRVIDASTAHRTADGWAYGFPEIGFDVAGAMRVSNPGCYPTGFLALVKPLIEAGLIPRDWPLTVNAVSGYSGGGKSMIAEFENGEVDTAWRTYALNLAHKHVPEMQRHANLTHAPIFAPAVARTVRGMIVDVPLMLGAMPGTPSPAAIADVLRETYDATPLVNFVDGFSEISLTIESAAGTDRLDLFVFANVDGSQARLIASLDNLGKGAAGACVQSLNILCGLDETTGLTL